jgi:hypothetical protein
MKKIAVVTTFDDPDAFDDVYLDDSDAELICDADCPCDNPAGHQFHTSCGETKCVCCGMVVWR